MPTSPEQRRAQMRAASARYRARKLAERTGEAIPPEAAHRRQTPIVARAAAQAALARFRRRKAVESLPNVRNPEVNLEVPRERGRSQPYKSTRGGQQRQAEALREQANATKLQAVGKARQQQLKDELHYSQNSERLQDAMTKEQQSRFQYLSEKIARQSQQSLALLFNYAGGALDYSGVIERILASPESRDVEEGLERLALLAEVARRASDLYSPKAIGRLTV